MIVKVDTVILFCNEQLKIYIQYRFWMIFAILLVEDLSQSRYKKFKIICNYLFFSRFNVIAIVTSSLLARYHSKNTVGEEEKTTLLSLLWVPVKESLNLKTKKVPTIRSFGFSKG